MIGILALAAAVALRAAGTHHAGGGASAPSQPAPPPRKPAAPHRPTTYGINLNALYPWTNERAFSNLTMAGSWHSTVSGWPAFDPARVAPDGTIRSLKPAEQAALPLSMPAAAHLGDVRIRCTWEGKGEIQPFAARNPSGGSNGSLQFTYVKDAPASIVLTRTDPADPVRHIDCREPEAERTARFDPSFVASLKPYRVVRFQGWQTVNANTGGDWSRRTLPGYQYVTGPDGVSVEDMVALCNQAGVDPWFAMDWKADAAYQANFAHYVHEHLDPARTVYLEIGNEVWNWGFNNSHLAVELGKARNLSPDGGDTSRMRAYAVHATEAFAIWDKEFGGDRTRLVRVLAGQAVWPDLLKLALDYKDTAAHVDAIAMAPYFGFDFFNGPRQTGDTDALFRGLAPKVDEAIGFMRQGKALADSYGLRFITYEAGQHLDYRGTDRTVMYRLGRDPRMGDLYRRYIEGWKREAGDLLMLFTNVDPVGPSTNWGMVEFYGQPMNQTPKLKALLDEQGRPG